MEIEPQEFIVKDAFKVQEFIEKYIGVESEINDCDNMDITIFDLTSSELKIIRRFITDNDLWLEQKDDDGEYNYSDYPISYIENV